MAKILTKKKKIIIAVSVIIAVVAIVVGGIFYGNYSKKEKVTLNVIGTDNIIENVNATGKVSSGASVEYKVGAVATVKEVYVKVGDSVEKGQLLASFDTKDVDKQIANFQESYDDAVKSYDNAVAEQKQAKVDLAKTNSEIKNAEKEVADLKAIIDKELSDAENKLEDAEDQLESTTNPDPDDLIDQGKDNIEKKLEEIADIVAKYVVDEEDAQKVMEIISKTIFDSLVDGETDPQVISANVEKALREAQEKGVINIKDIDAMIEEIKEAILGDKKGPGNDFDIDFDKDEWTDIKNQLTTNSNNAIKLATAEIRLSSLYGKREILNVKASSDAIQVSDKLVKTSRQALDTIKDAKADLAGGWTASIDGVITECNLVPGSDTNLLTTGIKLENMDTMVSTISLTEYDVHKVRVGMPATITTAFGTYEGEVATIAPVASGGGGASILDSVGSMAGVSGLSSLTQTGAGVECTVTINEPDSNIIVGFDADIEIKTGEFDNIPVVPIESLVLEKTGSYVYKYDPSDKTVTKTLITTGAISDTAYQITSGLEVGEQIVATPSATFKDETFEVRVIDKEKKANKKNKNKKKQEKQSAKSNTDTAK